MTQQTAFESAYNDVAKLTKDLRESNKLMSDEQARYLVDTYYQFQKFRIRSGNQKRAASTPKGAKKNQTPLDEPVVDLNDVPEETKDTKEPATFVGHLANQLKALEDQIKRALDAYTDAVPAGRWVKSQYGIGPVLAAGLCAHIPPSKFSSIGKLWAHAGMTPERRTWAAGQIRPVNVRLKTLAWKIGQSIKMFHKHENSFYGKLYLKRKEYESAKNEKLDYKDQAEKILDTKNIGKETEAYKWYIQGKLPPGHIDARACRYVAKMILSHFLEVQEHSRTGKRIPAAWVLVHGGHVDYLPPPGYDLPPAWEVDAGYHN